MLTYNNIYNLTNKVSLLIEEGRWSISDRVRRHIPEVIDVIEDKEIGRGEDDILWGPAKHGMYTLNDTYEAMRKIKEPSKWSSLAWQKTRIPCHVFIT